MRRDEIIRWTKGVTGYSDAHRSPPRKCHCQRPYRASGPLSLPTPSTSLSASLQDRHAMMKSPEKRRRNDNDDSETPRPSRLLAEFDQDGLASRSAPSYQQSLRAPSSSASFLGYSPRKQMRVAEQAPNGFIHQKFSQSTDLNASLAHVVKQLQYINNHSEFLPETSRDELSSLCLPASAFSITALFRVPALNFVKRILNRAAECEIDGEGESSWNMDVHAPVLAWVCRPENVSGLVDFRYWYAFLPMLVLIRIDLGCLARMKR